MILLLTVSASAQKPAVPEQWVKYEFDEGAVSILSPLRLKAVEVTLPADVPLVKTITANANDAGRIFSLTFSILKTDADAWTAAQRESFYTSIWEATDSSLKEMLRNSQLTWDVQLVEIKAVTISGRMGRQIGYSFGPYKGTIRAIVRGKRSYVASVLTLPEIHAQVSERYLNSFTITPAVQRRTQE
jgi:hypothetical protein